MGLVNDTTPGLCILHNFFKNRLNLGPEGGIILTKSIITTEFGIYCYNMNFDVVIIKN